MDDEWSPHRLTPWQAWGEVMGYTILAMFPWAVAPFLTTRMVPAAPPLATLASAPLVVWVLALLGLTLTGLRAGPLGAVGFGIVTAGVLVMPGSEAALPVGVVGMGVIFVGLVRTQLTALERERGATDG